MDLKLAGKVVIITGGATGIGKATALEFAREGCKVAVCARRAQVLKDAQIEFARLGYELHTGQVDVCHGPALEAFAAQVADRYGSVNIWFNNAGVNIIKPLMDFTVEEFEEIVRINLTAVFQGCQIAARQMTGRGGVILNAASFAALAPNAGRAPYSAAKAGVLSLTRTFAAELAPQNIRVLSYVPGMIETDIAANSIEQYRRQLLRDIPMQRFGRPEDLAKVLVFVASEAAGYITGTHIEISGGKRCVQNPWYAYER